MRNAGGLRCYVWSGCRLIDNTWHMDAGPSHDDRFMQEAIEMAVENVYAGRGGPFAALVVQEGTVIARGTNRVTTANDPTAHAEVTAIRRACEALGHFELTEGVLYTTCEPCPMCLGAIYWARLDRVYYAASSEQAAAAGFDDAHIYDEIDRPPEARRIPMKQRLGEAAQEPFEAWAAFEERVEY